MECLASDLHKYTFYWVSPIEFVVNDNNPVSLSLPRILMKMLYGEVLAYNREKRSLIKQLKIIHCRNLQWWPKDNLINTTIFICAWCDTINKSAFLLIPISIFFILNPLVPHLIWTFSDIENTHLSSHCVSIFKIRSNIWSYGGSEQISVPLSKF